MPVSAAEGEAVGRRRSACLAGSPPSGGSCPGRASASRGASRPPHQAPRPDPPERTEDRRPGPTALGQPRSGRWRGEGMRDAAGHRLRGGGEAAYLAEHPAELNRHPELGLGVLLGARGIPALVVRHGDLIRSDRRAGKSRSSPRPQPPEPPPAEGTGAAGSTGPAQQRSAGATSVARRCQRPAGAGTRRLELRPHRSSVARGKSHNIGVAKGGGASARPPAAHSAQQPAAPAAAILRAAGAPCHYLPAPPHTLSPSPACRDL